MKPRSSKRARALAITPEVRRRVYERDHNICIACGSPGLPEAHFIPRSKGGIGCDERNILTLCRRCHDIYDHGTQSRRASMRRYFKKYLRLSYPGDWFEDELYYDRSKEYPDA